MIPNLTSLKIIKEVLSQYEAQPLKKMGQNFLVSDSVLEKIIKSADLNTNDTILEIGPGIGALTKELARKVKKVIAVEKDKKMCQILKETLAGYGNVEIINDDILKIKLLNNFKLISNFKFQILNYKVVANLPYYITSPVIRKFLEAECPPEFMVLMVQKEVAQRICANPPNMSILAVSVQFYAEAKIISYVKKENFWPKPKVDSAIIKIIPGGQTSPDLFFKIVKAGFSQPRKQLVNNLTGLQLPNGVKLTKSQIIDWLSEKKIKPTQRAETLSINDWINLTK